MSTVYPGDMYFYTFFNHGYDHDELYTQCNRLIPIHGTYDYNGFALTFDHEDTTRIRLYPKKYK